MNLLTRLIKALNALSSQVYAFGAFLVGCLLLALHIPFGESIVIASLAVFVPNQPTSKNKEIA